jgi:hypothetical protein
MDASSVSSILELTTRRAVVYVTLMSGHSHSRQSAVDHLQHALGESEAKTKRLLRREPAAKAIYDAAVNALMSLPAPGAWIPWEGGACPVAADADVSIYLADGKRLTRRASEIPPVWWAHAALNERYHIVRYRELG